MGTQELDATLKAYGHERLEGEDVLDAACRVIRELTTLDVAALMAERDAAVQKTQGTWCAYCGQEFPLDTDRACRIAEGERPGAPDAATVELVRRLLELLRWSRRGRKRESDAK